MTEREDGPLCADVEPIVVGEPPAAADGDAESHSGSGRECGPGTHRPGRTTSRTTSCRPGSAAALISAVGRAPICMAPSVPAAGPRAADGRRAAGADGG